MCVSCLLNVRIKEQSLAPINQAFAKSHTHTLAKMMKVSLLLVAALLVASSVASEVEEDRWVQTQTISSFSFAIATFTSLIPVSCIPSSFFVATTACRRRRGILDESDLDAELAPSQPLEVEVSALMQLEHDRQMDMEDFVASSLMLHDERAASLYPMEDRFRIVFRTVTSTFTQYVVAFSVFTSTIRWGASANILNCLPAGFGVC